MALYRYEESIVKSGAGGGAVAKAAYMDGERYKSDIGAEAVDKSAYISAGNFAVHDYRHKQEEVRHSEVMLPDGAPGWASDPETLWRAAEAAERKRDGTFRKGGSQVAIEAKITLPRELGTEEHKQMCREFLQREFLAKGHVVHWSIHDKIGQDGERQPHAHALITLRRVSDEPGNKCGFERTKENVKRGYRDRSRLMHERREAWAEVQNRHMERAGLKERVDHRQNKLILKEALAERDFEKARRYDRVAEPKLGPRNAAREAKGERTKQGDKLRQVRAENERRSATYEFVGGFGQRARDGFCEARQKAKDTFSAFGQWCGKARDWCREKAAQLNPFGGRGQEPQKPEPAKQPRWRDELHQRAGPVRAYDLGEGLDKGAKPERAIDADTLRFAQASVASCNLRPEDRAVWQAAVSDMAREHAMQTGRKQPAALFDPATKAELLRIREGMALDERRHENRHGKDVRRQTLGEATKARDAREWRALTGDDARNAVKARREADNERLAQHREKAAKPRGQWRELTAEEKAAVKPEPERQQQRETQRQEPEREKETPFQRRLKEVQSRQQQREAQRESRGMEFGD